MNVTDRSYNIQYQADAPNISESGRALRKSRLGKDTHGLVCQECSAEGAVQLDCLCVLCRKCAKEHVHA